MICNQPLVVLCGWSGLNSFDGSGGQKETVQQREPKRFLYTRVGEPRSGLSALRSMVAFAVYHVTLLQRFSSPHCVKRNAVTAGPLRCSRWPCVAAMRSGYPTAYLIPKRSWRDADIRRLVPLLVPPSPGHCKHPAGKTPNAKIARDMELVLKTLGCRVVMDGASPSGYMHV